MARALVRIVAQQADGDVEPSKALVFYERDGTTPLATPLYTTRTGSTTYTSEQLVTNSVGTFVGWSPRKGLFWVGIGGAAAVPYVFESDDASFLDVADVGATDDGVLTTTRLQQALDSGARWVHFSRQTATASYRTGKLTIPNTVKKITGDQGVALAQDVVGADLLYGTDLADLTIEGLRLVGVSGAAQTAPNCGIRITSTTEDRTPNTNITVRDCSVTGFREFGISVSFATGVWIERNRVESCTNGIHAVSLADYHIDGNRVVTSQHTGVDTRAIQVVTNDNNPTSGEHNLRGTVIGNTIENWTNGQGIMSHDAIGLAVANNVITDVLSGINVSPAGGVQVMEDVLVTDNVIRCTATDTDPTWTSNIGITFGGSPSNAPAKRVRILGNEIYNANAIHRNDSHGGICTVEQTEDCEISNNLIVGAYAAGITCTGIGSGTHTRLKIRRNCIPSVSDGENGANTGIQLQSGVFTGLIEANDIDGCNRGITVFAVSGASASGMYCVDNWFGSGVAVEHVERFTSGLITEVSKRTASYRDEQIGMRVKGTSYYDVYRTTAAWTPGAVPIGGRATTDVGLDGAVLGDTVLVSFNKSVLGMVLSANVSTTSAVTVALTNNTNAEQTPDPGTLVITVLKNS